MNKENLHQVDEVIFDDELEIEKELEEVQEQNHDDK